MSQPLLTAACAALVLAGATAHAQTSTTVNLLEPGSGQRQPLRYRFESGRTETARLDSTVQVNLVAPGVQMPMVAATPITMELRLRTTEVAADGSARLAFEVLSAQATGNSPTSAQMNAALAGVKGMSGAYSLDNRGQVRIGGMAAAGPAQGAMPSVADIQEQMQQLAPPLPAEPVGIGARWQSFQQTSANGMEVTQTTEYVLRSRNGDQVELEVKVVDVTLPDLGGVVPGASVSSATAGGGGTMNVNLASLVPRASIDVEMAITMVLDLQGTSQSMAMQMKMKQEIAPAAAGARAN